MPPEIALLESRALRESVSTRTEALDRVKALVLLPDSLHITSKLVADYFEVTERAINSIIQRHREELESNGFRILTGSEALAFVSFNLKLTQVGGRGIAVYPRRTVLNVAMLLRDSAVAREIRTYLLDTEAASPRREPTTPAPPSWGMPPAGASAPARTGTSTSTCRPTRTPPSPSSTPGTTPSRTTGCSPSTTAWTPTAG